MMFDIQHTITHRNANGAKVLLKKSLVAFVLVFTSQVLFAQVKTSIDTTSIKIGEELKIQFEVEADSLDLVVFPDQQTFSPLEVIESYATDTSYAANKIRYRKQYGLTQFDSGSYTIPRQKIIFNNKFYLSDSINVEVRDVVVDTTKQKLFDIKSSVGIEKPPFNIIKLLYWLIPMLILLAVIGFLAFQRKKKRAQMEIILPPYEEAIVALKELDNSEYLLKNDSKEYYSLLTEIVKRYLDREVDDAAQESTTDELIERLQMHKKAGHFDFENEDIKRLDAILKRADLIKFARMQQSSGQAEADRTAVEEIINHTHEAIPEPTEEELLQDELYREEQLKKQKRKKIIIGVVTGLSVGVMVLAANIALNGLQATTDSIVSFFGGSETMKQKLEGRWFKSDYGAPSIIIETPDVLVRTALPISDETKQIIDNISYFESGEIGDDFYVAVTVTNYNEEAMQGQEHDLEVSLEGALRAIEARGGMNMIVKKEEFTSEKGVKGLKAYGDFNYKLPNGKIKESKVGYQVILFAQGSALQMVTLVYNQDKEYANQIKDRIINSIAVEIAENKQKPQNAQ
ncbi:BatD family protein [Patiriisocius marinus]|uniref:BatD family protein n=1 Tax=Patiriisocius marinus TaxID=1397112 RepID=UPI00232D00A7|nr:BatD family protein [Patiriisocius marinus]